MKQTDKLLAWFADHDSITSYQAFQEMFMTRLSAIIFELKKMGYEFNTERIVTVNRFGEKKWFAKYTMIKGDKNA